MAGFSIRNPYFIIVLCLMVAIIGLTCVVRMPVDLFPTINIPVVAVATFYAGMPAEQIEATITGRFERFFTLAGGIDHIESRSFAGVSIIRVYMQPGTNADAAVSQISSLALANLRRLPQGTYPPVVLKFDAAALPVCLVALKGEGLDETQLRDLGTTTLRNQVAVVPGASAPQPFGGRFRQIMVYVDPAKLEAHQLSPMDVVRAVNDANAILPAGDVTLGAIDYNLATNSQLERMEEIHQLPVKTRGSSIVRIGDVGVARDAAQIQTNVVRVDGQASAYLPVLRQGGDSNTIAIVEGVRKAMAKPADVPKALQTSVVFDQSRFIKKAIETLLSEGGMGLALTALTIIVFLGSFRSAAGVLLSIPLSALATFALLYFGGSSINTMILGGLALVLSRLIDNSVVVIENVYRHLEQGESPAEAAEKGGREVALPVLASTVTTGIVFFPVIFLYGVSKYLFSAFALAVVLALAASYVVAMTVMPLYCSRVLKGGAVHHGDEQRGAYARLLRFYTGTLARATRRPLLTLAAVLALFAASLTLYPRLGVAFFPRTDAGQFVINLKTATGTTLSVTEAEVEKVEAIIRETVDPKELDIIVSNTGVNPDFSALYTSNSGPHTAFIQTNLKDGHRTSTFVYMDRVRKRLAAEMPELTVYFQSGGLLDAVLNFGLPAPIDVQVSGTNLAAGYRLALDLSRKIRKVPGVNDVLIPQDIDAPGLRIEVDRNRAGELGLSQREVVQNVITALNSNQMIAPGYWIEPRTGYDYLLTVQYPEQRARSITDLSAIPLRGPGQARGTTLDAVSTIRRVTSASEISHYSFRRTIDIFVNLATEDLGAAATAIEDIVKATKTPDNLQVDLRGMVVGMRESFRSFGLGLLMSLLLLYLVLVAQFRSFVNPVIILLAVPTGLSGVLLALWLTGTTMNVQSLMGIVMMGGIVVSDSILIVEFTLRLERERGMTVAAAVSEACRVRLRPILMTSLATVFGLLPMAMKLGTGSEAYAPLARAIVGGVTVSMLLTLYVVPCAYFVIHRRRA